MEHLYIYYQVRPENRSRAGALVVEFQEDLARRTGQHGRVMRRLDQTASGSDTWMEVYENVSAATVELLNTLRVQVGIDHWIEGACHVERFVEQSGAD